MMFTAALVTGGVALATSSISNYIQNKKTKEITVDAQEVDRTPYYTQLFTSLGLLDAKKGDWVKCIDVTYKKNYRLIKFKISDTLSCEAFKKSHNDLEEKMLTKDQGNDYKAYSGENYKNKIQIYMDKGYMYFRVLNEQMDLVPYKFEFTKKYLIPIGTDLDDNIVYWNIKRDPHLKVIGSTGSGKSRQQNIVINHIYNNLKGAKLWLMDFKGGIEFGDYANTTNCVKFADCLADAPEVLESFREEYDNRLKMLKEDNCRSYDAYIEKHPNTKLQHGFLIVDEFADIMDLDTKEYSAIKELVDLARKVRATGLHIVLGTQRPTADSIPSSMKNNVTGTIGMKMENELNSRLVVDESGCELLQQSEAIGILESKKTYFRSFYIEDAVMEETVKKFEKKKEEVHKQEENTPVNQPQQPEQVNEVKAQKEKKGSKKSAIK